jgi:hypothetical protein
MPYPYTFGGTTVVAPAVLTNSVISSQQVLSLQPLGVPLFIGAATGGVPIINGGKPYIFNRLQDAQAVLRSGDLFDAITAFTAGGGGTQIVACVAGTKTQSTLTLNGASGAQATVTSGDYGAWTLGIAVQVISGTTSGTFALVVTYPDPISGQIFTVGGRGTSLDNLATYSAMAAAVAANPVITPPSQFNIPPLITITVVQDGTPVAQGPSNLTGGTGTGTQSLGLTDISPCVDATIDIPYDLAHLVKVYDSSSQAYATAQAGQVAVYGRRRRWVHQITASGASPSQSKAQNSIAVSAALITAATALDAVRASVVAQKIQVINPISGAFVYCDAAPYIIGMASYYGANGANGPSTPLTNKPIPGAFTVDYPILRSTGDMDRAILAGGMPLEAQGIPGNQIVRVVQSMTTQPNNPNTGQPWAFGEFSVVRGSDAVLVNVKSAVEEALSLGAGNTPKLMAGIMAEAVDVLELAKDAAWIVDYDKSSVSIQTVGTGGTDDELDYSIIPVYPLNHLGVQQTLLPFNTSLQLAAAA